MADLRIHSETAWKIAILYSCFLTSETRDLAAHIDVAMAAERERCAKIADEYLVSRNKEQLATEVAAIIRNKE